MDSGLHVTLRQSAPIALDFALSVRPGETIALVGPSGAGKSTVLRCIAGLHQPAAAKVICNGQVWRDDAEGTNVPAPGRRVGFVFQSYALFPHRTALHNIMEAMLDIPIASRRAEAARLLGQMELDGLHDRVPAKLSGGQQQRVALARALARKPDVLLLDEPFSAVDHPTRRQLHQALQLVRAASDMPILLVTHDIADAARIADRLCLVIEGRNVESGAADALLADPASQLRRWMG